MSYSFSVKAANKALAQEAVVAKFDEIVASQPVHARDRDAVLANAAAVINFLADNDAYDVTVSVNGYLSWGSNGADGTPAFSSVGVSCSAGHANRQGA